MLHPEGLYGVPALVVPCVPQLVVQQWPACLVPSARPHLGGRRIMRLDLMAAAAALVDVLQAAKDTSCQAPSHQRRPLLQGGWTGARAPPDACARLPGQSGEKKRFR